MACGHPEPLAHKGAWTDPAPTDAAGSRPGLREPLLTAADGQGWSPAVFLLGRRWGSRIRCCRLLALVP